MADVSTTLIQNNCSVITGYLLLSTILYKSGQAQQTCPFINAFLILLHIDFHQSIFGLHSHYDLQLLQFFQQADPFLQEKELFLFWPLIPPLSIPSL